MSRKSGSPRPTAQLNRKVIATDIDANARGQRTRLRLGNGVETSYEYDADTFRLQATLHAPRGRRAARLSRRRVHLRPGRQHHALDRPRAGPGRGHAADPRLTVSSACEFTYDAFYQLTAATGRVHQALLEHDYRSGLADARRDQGHPASQPEQRRRRRALHAHLRLRPRRATSSASTTRASTRNWTTEMWTSPTSNRSLPQAGPERRSTSSNPESRFDANGNTVHLPHLRSMDWNHANRLARAVIIDRSAAGEPDDAEYYVYGADGLRVRRVTERLVGGQVEVTETIYFDGCEIRRDLARRQHPPAAPDLAHHRRLDARWRRCTSGASTRPASRPTTSAQKKLHYLVGNHLGSVVARAR